MIRRIVGGLAAIATLSTAGAASAQTAEAITVTAVKSAANGLCMDVFGGSTADGAAVIQWTCHTGTNQMWAVYPATGGYRFIARHSGMCLDVAGGGTANLANVVQTVCNETSKSQIWDVTEVAGGYRLRSVNSGRCLDVPGGATTTGTKLIQYDCHGGRNQVWAATPVTLPAASATRGKWEGKVAFPLVPTSASMLGNGKLMLWSGSGTNSFGAGSRNYSAIWNPASLASGPLLVTASNEFFCQGTAMLADGKMIATGGQNPDVSSLLDTGGNWSLGPKLKISRGYAGQTLTTRNQVFTLGGSWSGAIGGKTGELYTPNAGWSLLPGVKPDDFLTADPRGAYRADNHMWLFATADGWVFHAGPSRKMHWVDTSGSGAVRAAGLRGNDGDAMNGNAVMYETGKILTMGGAPSYDKATPTANAFVVDISGGPSATPKVTRTGSMAYARTFANSVVLPDGRVMVMGGQSKAADPFADNDSALVPELWNPKTGTFTQLASATTPRNYHSVAMLLTDGRVLSAGGGLCGTCATNHADGEIFSPPYLFKADGTPAPRPTLASAPSNAAPGATITVQASGAVSYALIRVSSTTHSVNNDQRRIVLSPVTTSGTTQTLRLPSTATGLLPGNHLLFALDAAGVPSIAKIVNIR